MTGKVHVGTSGWVYKEWRGAFYPDGLPQRRWLEHNADVFPTVEVNGSFYKLPTQDTLRKWVDQVPKGFRFSLKMWRAVTHYKRLRDVRDKLDLFFHLVSVVPTRNRGVILVQLPPNQHRDDDRLRDFLAEVKDITRTERWRIAIEPRHDSWLDPAVDKILERARVARCIHDMTGKAADDTPNEASFVYLRRHGPGGDVGRGYTAKMIHDDAARIRRWADQGKQVYVYYNNDRNVHAPYDAQALMEAIGDKVQPHIRRAHHAAEEDAVHVSG